MCAPGDRCNRQKQCWLILARGRVVDIFMLCFYGKLRNEFSFFLNDDDDDRLKCAKSDVYKNLHISKIMNFCYIYSKRGETKER